MREIVVIHTEERLIELLRREDDGNWPSDPVLLTSDEALALSSIGFEASVSSFDSTVR